MFLGLQESQIKGALEAMLFVTDEPVSIIVLAEMLEVTPKEVEGALGELAEQLEHDERGIQLREVAGGWRLFTHPVFHELLEKYIVSWDTRRLSQAAIETLSIVAYSQPATRAEVAQIRGVNSDSSINSLVEKGLIREVGVAEEAGNATLYGTTKTFLERFGLRALGDLPELESFAPDEETREFIRERLSATKNVHVFEDTQTNDEALQKLDVEIEDDDLGTEFSESSSVPADMARSMLAEALASSLGVVEKIDLESLDFESDDDEE